METIKVLFVCMGNICRSPTAEGVFRHHVAQQSLQNYFMIDSAGTHGYHIGSKPDKRAQETSLSRGVDISRQRSRRVSQDDFKIFDYILAMDEDNQNNLLFDCPEQYKHKVKLFMSYASDAAETEVPDPYYGGMRGFEYVLDLVEAASEGLLSDLRQQIKASA